MKTIHLASCGAVTPVGLNSRSTCAAVRARVSRVGPVWQRPPPHEAQLGARVKAGRGLKRSTEDWLLNLAAKAMQECLRNLGNLPSPSALWLFPPESFREHPGMRRLERSVLLTEMSSRAGMSLAPESAVFDTGAAGVAAVLPAASALLASGRVPAVIIGGFDSFINHVDIVRLAATNRLGGPDNPQGVLPAEGAAFIALTAADARSDSPLARIVGAGSAQETKQVSGESFSVGDGLTAAFLSALDSGESPIAEGSLGFVVSNHNGERYAAWESVFHQTRAYRTRRDRLAVIYPAMSFGDLGSAAGPMALIVAALSIERGYAPSARGACELRSEGAARGVCIIEGVR